ncbi:MAG: U32 family peptidase [Bacilli bacterium]
MEYFVVANDLEHVKMLSKINVNTIIVSSKYSSYRNEFTLSEIEESLKIFSNLYVSIYDLISESIIEDVTNYIDNLLDIGIKNFIINDLGLIYYLQKFNVNIIYDNITITTNYEMINILSDFGIDNFVIGRETTLKEINDIAANTTANTIVHIQGMFPIFTSIRSLISNYFEVKNIDLTAEKLSLYQRDRQVKYPIIEKSNGVVMFSSYEQCGIEDIAKMSVDFLLIDQPFVENSTNINIVKMYQNYLSYTIDDITEISNYRQSRGFFYKKTMYKL